MVLRKNTRKLLKSCFRQKRENAWLAQWEEMEALSQKGIRTLLAVLGTNTPLRRLGFRSVFEERCGSNNREDHKPHSLTN